MKILDFEVNDLDTFDPDMLEQIENAKEKVLEASAKAEKEEKQSVAVRMQCEAVAEFIDTLWEKGTAEKVFGGKANLMKAVKAFECIISGLNSDTEKQMSELKAIAAKYSPSRVRKAE